MAAHYYRRKCWHDTFSDPFTAVVLFTKDVLDSYFSLLESSVWILYKEQQNLQLILRFVFNGQYEVLYHDITWG